MDRHSDFDPGSNSILVESLTALRLRPEENGIPDVSSEMDPIPYPLEELPLKLRAGVQTYFNRHPSVSALVTELRFALNGNQWVVGDAAGRRAFGDTPLSALKAFAHAFLPMTL